MITSKVIFIRLEKKVVCFLYPYPNKFLFKKIPTLKFFSVLPTLNQRKTCLKHIFLTKKKWIFFFYQPTYPILFSDCYWKQTISFFRPKYNRSRWHVSSWYPGMNWLTHSYCLEICLWSVVWSLYGFDNNVGITHKMAKNFHKLRGYNLLNHLWYRMHFPWTSNPCLCLMLVWFLSH